MTDKIRLGRQASSPNATNVHARKKTNIEIAKQRQGGFTPNRWSRPGTTNGSCGINIVLLVMSRPSCWDGLRAYTAPCTTTQKCDGVAGEGDCDRCGCGLRGRRAGNLWLDSGFGHFWLRGDLVELCFADRLSCFGWWVRCVAGWWRWWT